MNADAATVRLQEDLLAHLWEKFPLHCVVLADAQTRRAIELGIERAARHGFRATGDVCSYVNLMMFLGSHFDRDPQLPWISAALRDTSAMTRSAAMDRLYDITIQELTNTVGAGGEHYRRALIWARTKTFETLAQDYGADGHAGVRRWLRDLHRKKYDSLSERVLGRVTQLAEYFATQYALATPAGTIICAGLMFLLGSAIDRDPFHPSLGMTLRDSSLTDPMAKAQRLHRQAILQLERYMALERSIGNS